jgi:hypothetical protein
MSWKAINAAWDVRGLKCSQKCVLVCMANHANEFEGHTTFVSQEKIAKECGLTERSVITIQKLLKDAGHISRPETTGRAAKGEARFRFAIHPVTHEKHSPVTHENGNADTRKGQRPQVKSAQATHENGASPNIIISNQSIQRGTMPPPLPSKLPELIRDQKALIASVPFDDERQDAFHKMLWELETQKYGAPKSKRKTSNSGPASTAPQTNSAPRITDEQRERFVAELKQFQKKP